MYNKTISYFYLTMSKQRTRMDIQSESDFAIFQSNEYFFHYINKVGNEEKVNEKEFISIIKEYTNENYIEMNGYLRKGDYSMENKLGLASLFLFGLPFMI